MKKNELIKIIRVVVKEEVQKSLKKELTEVFKSLRTKPLVKETKKVVKTKTEQLAKDPVLNKILNDFFLKKTLKFPLVLFFLHYQLFQ